jgi:MFS family permease
MGTNEDAPIDAVSPRAAGEPDTKSRSFGFWGIMIALCITSLLAALENTVISTSLPIIIDKLNIGSNYEWITNIFFLTRYV